MIRRDINAEIEIERELLKKRPMKVPCNKLIEAIIFVSLFVIAAVWFVNTVSEEDFSEGWSDTSWGVISAYILIHAVYTVIIFSLYQMLFFPLYHFTKEHIRINRAKKRLNKLYDEKMGMTP